MQVQFSYTGTTTSFAACLNGLTYPNYSSPYFNTWENVNASENMYVYYNSDGSYSLTGHIETATAGTFAFDWCPNSAYNLTLKQGAYIVIEEGEGAASGYSGGSGISGFSGTYSGFSGYSGVSGEKGGSYADVGCKLTSSVNVSIPNGSWTVHPFNSEVWDTDSMHDNVVNNSRITITKSGKYHVGACIAWQAAYGTWRGMYFRKGGSTIVHYEFWPFYYSPSIGNGTIHQHHTHCTLDLVAGEYLELLVYQSYSGNINSQVNNGAPSFEAMLIAGQGESGTSGVSGQSGVSGFSGTYSGFSGYSSYSGLSGSSGTTGYSGFSGGLVSTARLTGNVTNGTTTAAKLTTLDKSVGIGTWAFKYLIRCQSAATATGVKFSVNHTGTLSSFVAMAWMRTTGTTAINGVLATVASATTTIIEGGAARAKSATANMFMTLSADAANQDQLVIIEGLMVVTAPGNIELYHASEVAANTTVMQDSALILTQVG